MYEGESGKCLYERGKKHLSEFRSSTSSNAMVIHIRKHHSGSTDLNFKMEAIKSFNTPLDRQLNEALRIKHSDADILMNSGSE